MKNKKDWNSIVKNVIGGLLIIAGAFSVFSGFMSYSVAEYVTHQNVALLTGIGGWLKVIAGIILIK